MTEFIELTSAEYQANDKYRAGEKFNVGIDSIIYYKNHRSKDYGNTGTEMGQVKLRGNTVVYYVMETMEEITELIRAAQVGENR